MHPKEAFISNGILNTELVRYELSYAPNILIELLMERLKKRKKKVENMLKGIETLKMSFRIKKTTVDYHSFIHMELL